MAFCLRSVRPGVLLQAGLLSTSNQNLSRLFLLNLDLAEMSGNIRRIAFTCPLPTTVALTTMKQEVNFVGPAVCSSEVQPQVGMRAGHARHNISLQHSFSSLMTTTSSRQMASPQPEEKVCSNRGIPNIPTSLIQSSNSGPNCPTLLFSSQGSILLNILTSPSLLFSSDISSSPSLSFSNSVISLSSALSLTSLNYNLLSQNYGSFSPVLYNAPPPPVASGSPSSQDGSSQTASEPSDGRVPPEKLQHVHDVLANGLPKLFTESINFTIYDINMVFENRFNGTTTVGLPAYMLKSMILRFVGHLKFPCITFIIIKITQHPEEGTIKVRWRICGVGTVQALKGYWKAKKFKLSSAVPQEDSIWYDGFSTFYVGQKGLITKHVADNMMPDDEKLAAKHKKLNAAARLAILLGLTPRPSHSSVMVDGLSQFL